MKKAPKSNENPLHRLRRGHGVEPAAFLYTAEGFVTDANGNEKNAHELLDRLVNEGLTESFIDDLNDRLIHVRKGVLVRRSYATGGVETCDVWSLDAPVRAAEGVALAFVRLLENGAFTKLKQCAARDCTKFHFRRGKWCSERCGSRQRGKNKRKADRERQML